MSIFKRRKKDEENPLLLKGYVEKTEKVKKEPTSKFEERANLFYSDDFETKREKKKIEPVLFEVYFEDVPNESEVEIQQKKEDDRKKKPSKENISLKTRVNKAVDEAKKQGLMFINENLPLEKPVKMASEGKFAFLQKLEFSVDAKENLKMANKDTYMDTPFAREHTIYNNVSEVSPFLRPYVVEKIKSQLGTSALKTTKGIFIDNDTKTANRISESKTIRNFIKKNKYRLKSYGFIKESSVFFEDFKDVDLLLALGHIDIVDMYLHPNGEITFYLIDTYDFNKDATDALNKAGRINQEKGILIPYFMIYSIKIDKETSEKLLK